MSEYDDLFAGFAVLEPSAEESARVVSRTRAAILATAFEQSAELQDASVRSTTQSAECLPNNDNGPSRRVTRLSYIGLATVASMLLMFAAIGLVHSRSAFAWSDVVSRIVGAKSLHCVMDEQTQDGKWIRTWEMMYELQQGYWERHFDLQGLSQTVVDDGKSHWVHRRGQKVATRQSGLSAADQLERLLNPLATNRSFQPDPAKDEVIDGTQCRCLTTIDESHQGRTFVWVDENKRLRRASVDRLLDDQWRTVMRFNTTYDVKIDAEVFKPRFDENVKIVDQAKLFEEVCPLDKAVHREEQFGYLFAIHELKRLGDFEYYMLVSFRPTDETRKKLALQQGEAAGILHPGSRHTIGKQHPVEFESSYWLGKARADGIEVQGYLVELSGFELQTMKRARPQLKLGTHADLWKEFGPWNDILFDVPLPHKLTPKEEAVRSFYDTIATLEAVPMDELYLHDPLDNRQFFDTKPLRGAIQQTTRKQLPKPSETNFETFFEHLQKRYLDSRPKTTVTVEEGR